jgi:Fe-S cluster biogenesis protein NfuA
VPGVLVWGSWPGPRAPDDLATEPSYAGRVQEKAEAVIAEVIRPLIEADGGRVELIEVTGNRVVIQLSGVCSGCPGQPYTRARIIEPALKRALGTGVEIETRFSKTA